MKKLRVQLPIISVALCVFSLIVKPGMTQATVDGANENEWNYVGASGMGVTYVHKDIQSNGPYRWFSIMVHLSRPEDDVVFVRMLFSADCNQMTQRVREVYYFSQEGETLGFENYGDRGELERLYYGSEGYKFLSQLCEET